MNNLAAPTTATPPRLGLPQDVSLKFGLNKMLGKKALSGNVNRDGKEFAKAPGLREYIRLDRAGYEQLRSTHSKSQVDRYQRTLCDAALEGNLAEADAALRMLKMKTPRDQDVQVQIHVADNAESRCRCAEIQEGLKKLQKRGLSFGIVVTPAGPGVTAGMGGAADQAEVRGLQQAHTVANILLNKAMPLEAMHAFGHSLSGYLAHIAASNSLDPLPAEIDDVISLSFGGNRAWSGLGNWEKAALVKGLCDGLRRVGEHYEKASGHKGALLGVVHVAVAGQLGTIAGLRARFGDAANNGVAPQNGVGNANGANPPVNMQALTAVADAARIQGKAYGRNYAAELIAWYSPPAPMNAKATFDHVNARLDPQQYNDAQLIAVWQTTDNATVLSLRTALQQGHVDASDANLATALRAFTRGGLDGMLEVEQEALLKGNAATAAEKAYALQMGHALIAPAAPARATPAPLVIPADKQNTFAHKFARLETKGRLTSIAALQTHAQHSATLSDMLNVASFTRLDLKLDPVTVLQRLREIAISCNAPQNARDALDNLQREAINAHATLNNQINNRQPLAKETQRRFAAALNAMAQRNADLQKVETDTLRLMTGHINFKGRDIKSGNPAAYADLRTLARTVGADAKVIAWLDSQQTATQAAWAAATAAASASTAPAIRRVDGYLVNARAEGVIDANRNYDRWRAGVLANNMDAALQKRAIDLFVNEWIAVIENGCGDKAAAARMQNIQPNEYRRWVESVNPPFDAAEMGHVYRAYLDGIRTSLVDKMNAIAQDEANGSAHLFESDLLQYMKGARIH